MNKENRINNNGIKYLLNHLAWPPNCTDENGNSPLKKGGFQGDSLCGSPIAAIWRGNETEKGQEKGG
jgi:hypothetical protein